MGTETGYSKITHIQEKDKDNSLLEVRCDLCHSKILEMEKDCGSVIRVKCRRCGTLLRIVL